MSYRSLSTSTKLLKSPIQSSTLKQPLSACNRDTAMLRLPIPALSRTQLGATRGFQSARCLSYSPTTFKGTQNSRPGWKGRHGDDHVLNRDALDAQSDPSHKGRQDKEKAAADPDHKEGGQGVHEKDDGNHNKRAKEDHPEAPEPVIGMNSERGGKGH